MFDVREAERSEDTRDYQAVIKLLLNHGANPNNATTSSPSWISPLMVATRCGNLETAKILLEHGASPSLHYAAYTNGYGSALDEWQKRESMIDLPLQYGAEVNLENATSETLLFAFIDGKFDDSIDLIRELRKRGAVVNYLNINYDTSLHLCQ
ncbi:unnamed protein product [Penicillium crustosum]